MINLLRRLLVYLQLLAYVAFIINIFSAGIPVQASEGLKLSVSENHGKVGDQVLITVSAENAGSLEGGEFVLIFDSALVKPVNYSVGLLINEAGNSIYMANLDYKLGQAKFMWVTAAADSADAGELFRIEFKLLKEGDTSIYFNEIVVSPPAAKIKAPGEGRIMITAVGEASEEKQSVSEPVKNPDNLKKNDEPNYEARPGKSAIMNDDNPGNNELDDTEKSSKADYIFVIALNILVLLVITTVIIIKRYKKAQKKQVKR